MSAASRDISRGQADVRSRHADAGLVTEVARSLRRDARQVREHDRTARAIEARRARELDRTGRALRARRSCSRSGARRQLSGPAARPA
jgi:hypothetical protein